MTTTGTREHPLAHCATVITHALTEVTDLDPAWLPVEAKADLLLRLTHAQERLAALKLRVMAASADVAEDHGARSVASWLAVQTRDETATCAAEEKLARALDRKYAALAAAMATGGVNRNQAIVITRALDDLPRRLGTDILAAAEAHLAPALRSAGLR